MFTRVKEIEDLALNYSKNQLASLSQQGLLPAQTAVLAGMMQDRMQAASIPAPTATVAEKILGASPTPPQGGITSVAPTNIASVAPQTGINQPMPSNMPTQEMAYGGLAELDTNDMYDENSFAGGGIIAFAKGDLIEDPNDPYRKQRGYDADTGLDAYGRMINKQLKEKAARGKKGLAGLEIEDTPATRGLMQSIFGSGMYGIDSTGTPSMTPAGELSVEKARLEEKIKTPSASTYGDIERLKEVEAGLSGTKGGYSPTIEELTPKPPPTPTPPPKNAGLGSFGIKPYAEKTQEQVMDEINKSRTLAGVESTEDFKKRKEAELDKEKAEIGGRRGEAFNAFLARSGFGMLEASQPKRGEAAPSFLGAFGAGAKTGFEGYAQDIKDIRSEEKDIRKRNDAIQDSIRAEKRGDADTALKRKDDSIAINRDIQYKNATLNLGAKKLDIIETQYKNADKATQAKIINAQAIAMKNLQGDKAYADQYKAIKEEFVAKGIPLNDPRFQFQVTQLQKQMLGNLTYDILQRDSGTSASDVTSARLARDLIAD
tara:strand:- start:2824 stop:4455 length:1632 start_codon:yes stop_codon:yes gene_type:complete